MKVIGNGVRFGVRCGTIDWVLKASHCRRHTQLIATSIENQKKKK